MKHSTFKKLYRLLSNVFILSMLLLMQACANLPVQQLSPELNLIKLGTCEAETPFAPSPDGQWLALVQNGLKLMDLKTKQKQQLSTNTPVALAWNHAGNRLVASFSSAEKSTLQVFETDAQVSAQADINGTVSDLEWGAKNQIILATITMKNYSFGSTLFTRLMRWDTVDTPTLLVEGSVTVKPRTVKIQGTELYKTTKLSVSPLGDEILYTRLHDPPAVRPYMKILLLHFEAGLEREVAQTALTLGEVFLLQDDMILFSDGKNDVKMLDPWTGLTIQHWQAAGHKLSVSVAGQYILTDGQLFDGNKQIATFSPTIDGLFSTDGSLFLRYQNQLHLLSGLQKKHITSLSPENRQQLLKIRKWRSGGLITHQEFLSQKKRILEK